MYPIRPLVFVRVYGQAPFGAKVTTAEQMRCNLCLKIFKPSLPEDLGEEKYDESVASTGNNRAQQHSLPPRPTTLPGSRRPSTSLPPLLESTPRLLETSGELGGVFASLDLGAVAAGARGRGWLPRRQGGPSPGYAPLPEGHVLSGSAVIS